MPHLLKAAAAALLLSAGAGQAGSVWIVGDVNAFSGDSPGLAGEILAGGPGIAALSGNTASASNFLGRGDVAETVLPSITGGELAAFDLFVLGGPAFFSSGPLGLSGAEVTAISTFLAGGGNMLMQVETNNAGDYADYNAFLGAIGSTIRFTGNRAGYFEDIGTLFQCNACNTFSGGTDMRGTLQTGAFAGELAFGAEIVPGGETPIPLPATLPLALGAFGLLGWMGRRAGRTG